MCTVTVVIRKGKVKKITQSLLVFAFLDFPSFFLVFCKYFPSFLLVFSDAAGKPATYILNRPFRAPVVTQFMV